MAGLTKLRNFNAANAVLNWNWIESMRLDSIPFQSACLSLPSEFAVSLIHSALINAIQTEDIQFNWLISQAELNKLKRQIAEVSCWINDWMNNEVRNESRLKAEWKIAAAPLNWSWID